MKKEITAVILAALLGGCATQNVPQATIYTLQPDFDIAAEKGRPDSASVLKLAPIRSTRPFTSTRMLYTENGVEQNSYAYSRWSDSPVAMLQLQFTEGLNRSGLFQAVLPPVASAGSDLLLEGVLLDFSLHLDGERTAAVMAIRFLLSDDHRRRVLGSQRFSARVPVDSPGPQAMALALNRASGEILQQLIHWLSQFPHATTR